MPQRRGDRSADPQFADDEALYRRYKDGHFLGGMLMPAALSFPRQSFVRAKYADPLDALDPACADGKDCADWGIWAILVRDVPTSVCAENCPVYEFWLRHEPVEQCYAHTEIWCNRSGQDRQTYKEPPATVKALFRTMVARRLRTIKDPST